MGDSIWRSFRWWWLRRRADTHIVSFPKCGRTWLVLMLAKTIEYHFGIQSRNPLKLRNLRRPGRGIPLILQHHDGGPEFLRPDELERDKGHYRGARVVFLVRDPRDVVVSSYYQKTKRNINYSGSLQDYVYEPVGSTDTIVDFYNIWARNRDVPRDFLLMTYEGLHADTHGELRRLVDFLGLDAISDDNLHQAVEFCSFDNMRRLEAADEYRTGALAPRDPNDPDTFKTREGRVGSYRDQLGSEEIAHIDAVIDECLDPLFSRYRSESLPRSEWS